MPRHHTIHREHLNRVSCVNNDNKCQHITRSISEVLECAKFVIKIIQLV